MDLVAVSPSPVAPSRLHFNWFGWSLIGGLLGRLGADLSQMAAGNDGDLVDAATAADWGCRLAVAVVEGRVLHKVVCDPDGEQLSEEFIVATLPPELAGRRRPASALAEALFGPAAPGCDETVDSVALADVDATVAAVGYEVLPLSDDDRRWLLDAAVFFSDSGGFRQF